MGWVKLDDGFLDHPKFLQVGPVAGYIALAAMAWSNRNLTDGFIPDAQVSRLANLEDIIDEARSTSSNYVYASDLAHALVEAGLWDPADGGFQIHDYHDHQQTAEAIKARRLKDRDRKSTGRDSDSARIPRGVQTDSTVQEVRSKKNNSPPSPPGEKDEGKVLTFGRARVPDEQRILAEAVLADFNEQAGTGYGAYRGDGRASEDLKRILGALRDSDPPLTLAEAHAVTAWRLSRPFWQGKPHTGVVFGPNVYAANRESARPGADRSASKSSLELAAEIHGGAA